MATAVTLKPQQTLTEEQLAALYAGGLIYKTLIEFGEPIKASEVARAAGRPDIDTKLARVILATNPHMTAVDRKWTLWTRYLDTRSTVDRNLGRILHTFGQPIRQGHLAHELGSIYGRPAEIYEEMLTRLVKDTERYFLIEDDFIAPLDWLLNTEETLEEEVLFENFLDDDDVFPYIEAAKEVGLTVDNPGAAAALLNRVGKPLKSKAIQFLAWRTDPDRFNPMAFYSGLFSESGAEPLTDGTWIGPDMIASLIAQFPVIAQQEVSDNAEAEAQEAAQPLTIGDAEREQLVRAVLDSEVTVYATRLLEDIFEVTPDYRTYNEDLQSVIHTLTEDERILWVGADRFRPQGTLPGYVFSVPGLLDIPEDHYTDAEGILVDQLLEDDGFDGGLEREIMNLLAQDVLDEEPVPLPDPNPPSNARAVVKYHHKQIGTLPLCQFPSGFFPPEPGILETEFTLPGGHKALVWVNNETRLMYGLLDWFQSIPIDSGATFTLERQAADRFVISYNDESEPTMFISRNRINELLALQERAEEEELSTFDIMKEIMEHYRKGIEFLTLLTEVNIVRRVTRRMVASVLSEYHCFFQRGGSWVYDLKKLPLGFDKSKRKHLVK